MSSYTFTKPNKLGTVTRACFLGNLSSSAQLEHVSKVFSSFGSIEAIETGSPSHAYVVFSEEVSATAAVQTLHGRMCPLALLTGSIPLEVRYTNFKLHQVKRMVIRMRACTRAHTCARVHTHTRTHTHI